MSRRKNQRYGSYAFIRHDMFRSGARTCYFCSVPMTMELCKPNTLTVDHLQPLSRGGVDGPVNMKPVCSKCNSDKGDMNESEYNERILAGQQYKPRPDMAQVLSGHPMKEPQKRREFWEAMMAAKVAREEKENG